MLKRPDAEHLIMGLNSGAFSLETIVHQLSNPALQVLLQHEINFWIYKNDSSWAFIENLTFVFENRLRVLMGNGLRRRFRSPEPRSSCRFLGVSPHR